MKVVRYLPEQKDVWNDFVRHSKNGTFLFCRQYMDYHSDRFADHSLMFYDDKNRLVALMPGNVKDNVYYSHQGLTYGGFVLTDKASVMDVMTLFDVTIGYLNSNGYTKWFYKQMPTIYHRCPAEEDEYALWRYGAKLECCNIATSIPLHTPILPPVEKCRRRRQRQAIRAGFEIVDNADVADFWPILEESLMAHHNAKPVHTVYEMSLLKQQCPDDIDCKLVVDITGKPVAGVVLFVTPEVVHVQYGHATLEGYESHVMDYLYFELLERYRSDGHTLYFDFGTSNEQSGRYLNENLVIQKEGFGGRAVAYKTYRIDL